MNIIRKVFYPNIVPKIKNHIAGCSINNNIKKAFVSDTGLLTIHFWAPTFKWSISLANIADINRDPKLLSLPQQFAIGLTGLLFSRFAYVIKPRNINLITINIFMSITAMYQITRIAVYKYNNINNEKEIKE
ncbi:mitochondrial pyruvate carrier protein 2, putative [Plasmodium berghei]|uniref:Mitochondrial pyruvate carrier n=2 Tax=Plasmodium berghei TaxID=5821 RepID=A0A509APZ2_PLABA|nr:mitochondrial pyruvate carrier protein 2, putative [Plasmodium berghei ANKA]CXI96857.1 mitochondrial pyruvate carrier protein 2, putative [Plasmodium berghei]SCL97416.1 mitochondrial pyruvate carrier protein 2, putative [Plasmodium berghei]SCM16610.1 mitochondrial pyruvate carrier protein 2, putative [Plasmodium berghei]SCM18407.1 mitochondrial pyruvate carrier protein 2, putative [Plasmodium berghei]SCN27837.1 mitochondrial pyruvate carrier protein 2, putative [Plasmodium berghei]|eukprot:XP_034423492.1 mitochondrial pyruvate carrier protein 2, putative [Plasmodium berghei ANKA]